MNKIWILTLVIYGSSGGVTVRVKNNPTSLDSDESFGFVGNFDGPEFRTLFPDANYNKPSTKIRRSDIKPSGIFLGKNNKQIFDSLETGLNYGIIPLADETEASNDESQEEEEEGGGGGEQKQSFLEELEDETDFPSDDVIKASTSRPKRNVNQYPYPTTYRDFVRDNFGIYEAPTSQEFDYEDEESDAAPQQADNVEYDDEEAAGSQESDDGNKSKKNKKRENQNESGEADEEEGDAEEVQAEDASVEEEGGEEGGDDDDYQRVKKMAERQTSEDKKNPEYCKIVQRKNKECTVCKNPKTGSKSETCSYATNEKPKKYSFTREKNYDTFGGGDDSKDKDDDDDNDRGEAHNEEISSETPKLHPTQFHPPDKTTKLLSEKKRKQRPNKYETEDPNANHNNNNNYGNYDYSDNNSKARQITRTPVVSVDPFVHYSPPTNQYYFDQIYHSSAPEAVKTATIAPINVNKNNSNTDTRNRRNADEYLREFNNRDFSNCTKKIKKDLTCYQCRSENDEINEDCVLITKNRKVQLKLPKNHKYDSKEDEKITNNAQNSKQFGGKITNTKSDDELAAQSKQKKNTQNESRRSSRTNNANNRRNSRSKSEVNPKNIGKRNEKAIEKRWVSVEVQNPDDPKPKHVYFGKTKIL